MSHPAGIIDTAADRREDPLDDLLRALSAIWSDVLGREVGLTEDIFDLDIDSLKAVELSVALRRADWPVSVSDLLDLGTIERLALHLRPGTGEERR